jgi:hypothetical protein|tara:strand:+ start:1368 stop:1703 length:336 start_codon:yes stop_codon:yes gene_type:complete
MFKKLILFNIIFILISFPVLSQELENSVTELNITTPVSCASTVSMEKLFTDEFLVFTGLLNKYNIVKMFIAEDKSFAIMMENSGGLSCVFFTGIPGILKNKADETRSELNG